MCKQLKYIPKLRNIVVLLSLYSVEVQVVNPRITRRNVTKWACIHTIIVKISVYTEWSTSKPFVSVARQHALAYTARYCYIVFTVCPTRWGIVPIDECTYRRNLSTTRCAIIPVFHPQYRRYNRGGSPFVRLTNNDQIRYGDICWEGRILQSAARHSNGTEPQHYPKF